MADEIMNMSEYKLRSFKSFTIFESILQQPLKLTSIIKKAKKSR